MEIERLVAFVRDMALVMPSWFNDIFWNIIALIFIVQALTILIKATSAASLVDSSEKAIVFFKSLGKSMLTGSLRAIDSPIKRPRARLVVLGGAMAVSYMVCLVSFTICLVAAWFSISISGKLPFQGVLAIWAFMLFFLYAGLFFLAEADRVWLALRAQWLAVRPTGSKNGRSAELPP